MRGLVAASVWCLSIAPLGAEVLSGGEWRFLGATRVALVAFAWLAWAGMPESGTLTSLAACLPPLGLALGLDWRDGVPPGALTFTAASILALACTWRWLSLLAGRGALAERLYSWCWLLCVPLPASYGASFYGASIISKGAAEEPSSWLSVSPLVWLHQNADAVFGRGIGGAFVGLIPSVLAALWTLCLLHLALFFERETERVN